MRISDWSSDVCSSDLFPLARFAWPPHGAVEDRHSAPARRADDRLGERRVAAGGRGSILPFGNDDAGSRAPAFMRHHPHDGSDRSEEHTSELQSLMRISYAVFCLKKKQISKTVA